MKNHTVINRHGFASVNGHPLRMTLQQSERYAARELREFPRAQSSVYRMSDPEMVAGAMEWPEMTESMEKSLC